MIPKCAALHAAVAVLAALRGVARGEPGQWIEVPMFDAVLSTYNITVNELLEPPDDRVMNPIYDAGPHGAIATAGSVQHVWALLVGRHSDLTERISSYQTRRAAPSGRRSQ